MKLKSRFLNRSPRLELVSLMDVMFLVLVFFVYSVFYMSVHRGLKVELPGATGAAEKGERVVITIDAHDSMSLNGRILAVDGLVQEVARLMSVHPLPVLIAGDRRASLGTGVGLLARLKAAGVEKASFQVSGEAESPAKPIPTTP